MSRPAQIDSTAAASKRLSVSVPRAARADGRARRRRGRGVVETSVRASPKGDVQDFVRPLAPWHSDPYFVADLLADERASQRTGDADAAFGQIGLVRAQ